MLLISSIRALIQVHPLGVSSSLKLYIAFLLAPIVRILLPHRFRTVGYLIPGKTTITVTTHNIKAKIRPRTSDLDMFALILEPKTLSWFQPEPGQTVVDIGAHIGRYTLTAASNKARVYAVEPEPTNFQLLNENIGLNHLTNVSTFQLALSSNKTSHQFYVARRGDTATSSLEPDWRLRIAGPRRSVAVKSETLDQLVTSLELKKIDWLKIDVEGHEVSVLGGGQTTLEITERLIIEVSKGHESACLSLAEKAGLKLVAVEQQIGTQVSSLLLSK